MPRLGRGARQPKQAGAAPEARGRDLMTIEARGTGVWTLRRIAACLAVGVLAAQIGIGPYISSDATPRSPNVAVRIDRQVTTKTIAPPKAEFSRLAAAHPKGSPQARRASDVHRARPAARAAVTGTTYS